MNRNQKQTIFLAVYYAIIALTAESYFITMSASKALRGCSTTMETTLRMQSENVNSDVNQFKIPNNGVQSRKTFFQGITITTFLIAMNTGTKKSMLANALDMDAFMNQELNADKSKSELSDDAKTCKYAAPGQEKGDACVRAGMSTAGKNGGVDAYGRIDRGDFVRCKTSYPMIDGKYVKTVNCE